jgi:hypothetical protein
MKNSRKEESKQSKQSHVNIPIPDIRNKLDSRKEKEAGYVEHESKAGKQSKKK